MVGLCGTGFGRARTLLSWWLYANSFGLARQGQARHGAAKQDKARTLLSWWRLRECFGLAWLGEARRGEAGKGKDSFELVAVP
jgi:hypothetical protein